MLLSSRGGHHYFFKAPNGSEIKCNQGLLGRNIDVRGVGGHIVLAPSLGAQGGKYEWLNADQPIVEAPGWLVELLTAKPLKASPPRKAAKPPQPRPARAKALAPIDGGAVLGGILAQMRSTEEGSRNNTLYSLSVDVGRLIRNGGLPESAIDELAAAAVEAGLPMDEAQRTVESGLSASIPKKPKRVVVSEDLAAEHLITRYGDNIRYCQGSGWLEYSEPNKVWQRDMGHSVLESIRQVCRGLNADGSAVLGRASTFRGVAAIAQNDPRIHTEPSEWDKYPMLLNTPKGVISLDGAPIEVPLRELHLTKSTRVAPANGKPAVWMNFLSEITLGDQGLQRYLQQIAGYCLTGSTKEQALFFAYGDGGNGKGVFLSALGDILGDYSAQATMEVFTVSKSSFDRHTTDIAMLAGARSVMASETEEGRSWRESQVKQMTGGDKITCRFMRQDNFTFKPEFKIFVISNNKPRVLKVDDAMRRRMNIIPFNFKPQVIDRGLDKKLEAEYPQILSWAIAGCQDWLKNGFTKPQCVIEETNDYFREQDLGSQWLVERCEVAKDATEQAITLFNDWKIFMVSKGENPTSLNVTRFGNEMKRLMAPCGFDKHHAEGGTIYRGIRLKADADDTSNTVQPLFPVRRR